MIRKLMDELIPGTPDDEIDNDNATQDLEEDIYAWIDCHRHLGLSRLTMILFDASVEFLYRTHGVSGADALILSLKHDIESE